MKFEIFGWLKNLQSLIFHAKIVNIQRISIFVSVKRPNFNAKIQTLLRIVTL